MSKNMRKVLNAFEWNDLAEVDITVSPEKEDEIKKKLNIKYGGFEDFLWGSVEKNGKIILESPTLPIEAAKKLVRMCPVYASITVTPRPVGYEGKTVYEGSPFIPADDYKALRERVKKISKTIKDREFGSED